MTIETLATARAKLPTFPGASLTEQLQNGRNQATAILRQYVSELRYDERAANEVLDRVGVWVERNREELEKSLADPSREQLGAALCLAFDAKMAQDYVIASFTTAAEGLGPWMSGWVAREGDAGRLPRQWIADDAASRLKVFGSIVRMEQDGFLRHLFRPGPGDAPCPQAVGAFGITFAAIAVIVAGAVAAVVACTWIIMRSVNARNEGAN